MFDVLNRKQFRQYWETLIPELSTLEQSPLWIPEAPSGVKSRWFVKVKPIQFEDPNFWIWHTKNCRGLVRCYSSGNEEEWWGFTHRADIAWWLLKWAQ